MNLCNVIVYNIYISNFSICNKMLELESLGLCNMISRACFFLPQFHVVKFDAELNRASAIVSDCSSPSHALSC